MKIGIYDPYLDTLGGGERYILSIASCLKEKHKVSLFWDDSQILKKASVRFGIDVKDINLTRNIFLSGSFIGKLLETRNYDVIFYMSDGSIPTLLSEKNILIFQFPVNWINGNNFLTKLKLSKIAHIICYSDFVKKFLDKTFSIKATVLSPAVHSVEKNIKKENVILTVGRFTKAVNTKKHEILIDVFKKLYDGGLLDWKLIIIGSVLPGEEDYVEALRKKTKDYPIEIIENSSFDSLVNYYNKAKIYWHASGFGEDLEKYPEKAEHFGISTVEAMSAGTVPVVFNGGGQKEIVKNKINGFCWNSLNELSSLTEELIGNQKLWQEISKKALERAKDFNNNRFCQQLEDLIK